MGHATPTSTFFNYESPNIGSKYVWHHMSVARPSIALETSRAKSGTAHANTTERPRLSSALRVPQPAEDRKNFISRYVGLYLCLLSFQGVKVVMRACRCNNHDFTLCNPR